MALNPIATVPTPKIRKEHAMVRRLSFIVDSTLLVGVPVSQLYFDYYCDLNICTVGKWCENMEENHCDDDEFSFCLNDGDCNPAYP